MKKSLRITVGALALVGILTVALVGCAAPAPIVIPAPQVTVNIPAQPAPQVTVQAPAASVVAPPQDTLQQLLQQQQLQQLFNQGGNQWGGRQGGGGGHHGGHHGH